MFIKNIIRVGLGFDREFVNVRMLQFLNPTCRISPRVIVTTSCHKWIRLGKGVAISHGTVLVVDAEDKSVFDDSFLEIGDGTYIGEMNNLRAGGGGIRIGRNVLMSQNVSIIASNHSMDPATEMMFQAWDKRKCGVIVEDDVWVGCNSVILPGVTLGKGCVVGAGSVVTRSIPSMAIAVGNPARVVRNRAV